MNLLFLLRLVYLQELKYFKKLRDRALKDKFKDAVIQIQLNPYEIGEAKLGDLAGIYGYDIKHKGTDYEIALNDE